MCIERLAFRWRSAEEGVGEGAEAALDDGGARENEPDGLAGDVGEKRRSSTMRSSSSISSDSRGLSSIEQRIFELEVLPRLPQVASAWSQDMLEEGVHESGVFSGAARGLLKGMGEEMGWVKRVCESCAYKERSVFWAWIRRGRVRTCKAASSIASWPMWLALKEATRSSTEMLMMNGEGDG